MFQVQIGHTEGHADLCYTDDGKSVISCGREGDVKIWNVCDEDIVPKVHSVGDCATAITIYDSCVYVGIENVVRKFMLPDMEDSGTVVRFTGSVTDIKIHNNLLFASSSDFTAKLLNLSTFTILYNLVDHEAPILSISMHTNGRTLATASLDGYVKVWDKDSCLRSIQCIPKGNDFCFAKTLCKLEFSSDGYLLAVPSGKNVDILTEKDIWNVSFSLIPSTSNHDLINVATFSNSGESIAAGSIDGFIFIWNISNKQQIVNIRHPHKRCISVLKWNPTQNQLAFSDKLGQFCLVDKFETNETFQELDENGDNMNDLFDDNDSDVDISIIKKKTLSAFGFKDEEDLAGGLGEDTNDDIIPSAEEKPTIKEVIKPIEVWKPNPPQKAFQPGSTPIHLKHRFMVWNSIGVIRHYQTEEDDSIDITFHDVSIHHAVHIHNDVGYMIGDVNRDCFILGSFRDDIEKTPSSILCEHFSSWDSNKRWSINLPMNENVVSLVIGDKWLAISTDMNFIRILTIGGVQMQIFSTPGPCIAIAATFDKLIIVYHRGMALENQNCLGIRIIKIDTNLKCILDGQLPLSPNSNLSWIGFSKEGTPVTVDSMGIVRMFVSAFGDSWVPVANLKDHTKGKSDNFFVVGLCEESEQIRCILCKGSTYPSTLPWPVITTLPLNLPFANKDDEKSKLEEKYWRTVLLKNSLGAFEDSYLLNKLNVQEHELIIRMFAMACKQDREWRAVEISKMSKNVHNMSLTVKYANKLGLTSLTERINNCIREMVDNEAQNTNNKENSVQDEDNMEDTKMVNDDQTDIKPRSSLVFNNFNSSNQNDMTEMSEVSSQLSQQSWQNPFRAQSTENLNKIPSKTFGVGSSIFDGMQPTVKEKQKEPLKVVKRKQPTQSLLSVKRKKENLPNHTAFSVWLTDNKSSLEEEHPDLSSDEMALLAAKRFKALSKEERQVFMEKSKNLNFKK